jgi:hypothetical protein
MVTFVLTESALIIKDLTLALATLDISTKTTPNLARMSMSAFSKILQPTLARSKTKTPVSTMTEVIRVLVTPDGLLTIAETVLTKICARLRA